MTDAATLFAEGLDYCRKGKYDEAIPVLHSALEQAPDHLEARFNLAKVYFRLKRYEEAIAQFDLLLSHAPDHAHYLSERAVAYHLMGDNAAAMADMDRAAALEPHNPYRFASRAFLKARIKDLHGAIADYDRALELDPEDAISLNNKGMVEEQLGYKERAKASYAKADALDPIKKQEGEAPTTQPATGAPAPQKVQVSQEVKSPDPVVEIEETPTQTGWRDYWQVIRETFGSKEGWKEFGGFVKGKIKGKD